MNPKRTWIMTVLALGLFFFIFLHEWRRNDSDGTPAQPAQALPGFDARSVSSVEVILRTNLILRAERTNEEWTMTLPVPYPAHASRIEGLLAVFSQLSRQSHISAQELMAQKQPLAAFGLDPPQATVIALRGQDRWELKIGGKTPVGQQVYVQLVGSEGVYFTDTAFLERLPRVLDDWRDPAFLRLKGLAFNRLEVKSGGSGFEVQTDPSTHLWKITKPLEVRANNSRIEQLLQLLRNWPIARFVPETPAPDMGACGLQPPETVLTLGQGTNDLLVVYFGKSPTNSPGLVYARYLTQPYLVLVPKDNLETLRAPFTQLRENRLVSASLANTDLIEVEADEKFTLEKTRNGGWLIASPQRIPADPELVRNFFGDVSTVNIAEYVRDVVTDFSEYGLAEPRRRYVFRAFYTNSVTAVTNPVVARVDFGREQDGKIFTRVAAEISVYAAPWNMVSRLPTQSFQLWDRQLWRFTTNETLSLEVSVRGQTVKFARNNQRQWILDGTPLDDPLPHLLDEVLFRFGTLKAESWVACGDDKMSLFGFPDNDHRLVVELTPVAGQPRQLTMNFGAHAPSRNIYASIVWNGKRVVFEYRLADYQFYLEMLSVLPASAPAASAPATKGPAPSTPPMVSPKPN